MIRFFLVSFLLPYKTRFFTVLLTFLLRLSSGRPQLSAASALTAVLVAWPHRCCLLPSRSMMPFQIAPREELWAELPVLRPVLVTFEVGSVSMLLSFFFFQQV